jgi:hypothetical protein
VFVGEDGGINVYDGTKSQFVTTVPSLGDPAALRRTAGNGWVWTLGTDGRFAVIQAKSLTAATSPDLVDAHDFTVAANRQRAYFAANTIAIQDGAGGGSRGLGPHLAGALSIVASPVDDAVFVGSAVGAVQRLHKWSTGTGVVTAVVNKNWQAGSIASSRDGALVAALGPSTGGHAALVVLNRSNGALLTSLVADVLEPYHVAAGASPAQVFVAGLGDMLGVTKIAAPPGTVYDYDRSSTGLAVNDLGDAYVSNAVSIDRYRASKLIGRICLEHPLVDDIDAPTELAVVTPGTLGPVAVHYISARWVGVLTVAADGSRTLPFATEGITTTCEACTPGELATATVAATAAFPPGSKPSMAQVVAFLRGDKATTAEVETALDGLLIHPVIDG